MPLEREIAIKYIGEKLGHIQSMVYILNGQQLYDINHALEDFCTGLLNQVYGWNLTNINHERKNSPAIDLGDLKNSVAVQVTSDSSGRKIKDTVSKFCSHGYYVKFSRLIIVLISPKQNSYKVQIDTTGDFNFSISSDIKDFRDLLDDIAKMDLDKIVVIKRYIEKEFPDEYKQLDFSLYDRMKRVINLILSEQIRAAALDVEFLFGEDVNERYSELINLIDLQEWRMDFMDFYESELQSILCDEPEKKREYETLMFNSEQFDYYEPLYSFCDNYIIRVKIPYAQDREEFIDYRREHTEYLERIKQIEVAKRLCVDAAKNELKQRVKM